jgi:tryptophan 2,3-dioxygenase
MAVFCRTLPTTHRARYLALDTLLDCQHPQSALDDEMLFIIIYQTKELWLKQIILELALAQNDIRTGKLVPEAYFE